MRRMPDEESLIRLVASNAQGEMSSLGVGDAGEEWCFSKETYTKFCVGTGGECEILLRLFDDSLTTTRAERGNSPGLTRTRIARI